MRDRWYKLVNTMPRGDFYDFYSILTAMAEPLCGDTIYLPSGQRYNLKKVVRRIRITVMGVRFKIDYAKPYTSEELNQELDTLERARLEVVDFVEKKAMDKLISALESMFRLRMFEVGH